MTSSNDLINFTCCFSFVIEPIQMSLVLVQGLQLEGGGEAEAAAIVLDAAATG